MRAHDRERSFTSKVRVWAAFCAALVMAAGGGAAAAPAETVLYSFCSKPSCSDGAGPLAGLIADSSGNLYGTTSGGPSNFGTVFKLSPSGTETVLYSFTGSPDGGYPAAGVIADSSGNLYGTTELGGFAAGIENPLGYGVVFKLAPGGTETVLLIFGGGEANPVAGLIRDSSGNLYGTTSYGNFLIHGTVFKLAPDGTETGLHGFSGGSDGAAPAAGLIFDSSGNLYGTTAGGGTGCGRFGCGVVFKLTPGGTLTVLHSFKGSDGANSDAGLIADSAGNLYGTTSQGGASGTGCGGAGCGVVFKLAPGGTLTVLHAFTGGSDGANPAAGLIFDSKGNLYGTAKKGGTSNNGVVFKLAPGGTLTVLHSFAGGASDGAFPVAGLIADGSGNLYGTTEFGGGTGCYGGFGCGTVFKLTGTGFVP